MYSAGGRSAVLHLGALRCCSMAALLTPIGKMNERCLQYKRFCLKCADVCMRFLDPQLGGLSFQGGQCESDNGPLDWRSGSGWPASCAWVPSLLSGCPARHSPRRRGEKEPRAHRHTLDTPARRGPAGRGRASTKPAWMTNGPSKEPRRPSGGRGTLAPRLGEGRLRVAPWQHSESRRSADGAALECG